jgi:biotin carboxylase
LPLLLLLPLPLPRRQSANAHQTHAPACVAMLRSAMGDKARAKTMMSAAGVPVVPGYHGDDQEDERCVQRL